MSEVTQLLEAAPHNPAAAAALLPAVYDELRILAVAHLARESPGQTLQPTALVHEAYLRLIGPGDAPRWQNRAHFCAAAAEAMRRILIDIARKKGRQKRGGGRTRVDLASVASPADLPPNEYLDLNDALDELTAIDPQKGELVKLRFFTGVSIEDAAACLGVSRATAERWWYFARAWLYDRVRGNEPSDSENS